MKVENSRGATSTAFGTPFDHYSYHLSAYLVEVKSVRIDNIKID